MVLARRAALVGLLLVSSAGAQDLALAESLFQEGRKLMEAGNTGEACKKFEASLRMDRSSGTLLNLAECHLAEGKNATAWAEFLAAEPLARKQGNEKRAEVAARRAAEVQKTLSYLTIAVSVPTPGMEVRRNDLLLEEGSLSTRVATDPGTYTIRATAAGYEPWSVEVKLKPGADEQTVTVPALKLVAQAASSTPATSSAPPPAPTPGAAEVTPGGGSRTLAFVALGTGAVLVGLGGVFGVKAMSTYKDAERQCPGRVNCDPSVKPTRDRADSQALLSTVGMGVGAAALGVGAVLLLMRPPEKPTRGQAIRWAPQVSPSTAGVTVHGAF